MGVQNKYCRAGVEEGWRRVLVGLYALVTGVRAQLAGVTPELPTRLPRHLDLFLEYTGGDIARHARTRHAVNKKKSET